MRRANDSRYLCPLVDKRWFGPGPPHAVGLPVHRLLHQGHGRAPSPSSSSSSSVIVGSGSLLRGGSSRRHRFPSVGGRGTVASRILSPMAVSPSFRRRGPAPKKRSVVEQGPGSLPPAFPEPPPPLSNPSPQYSKTNVTILAKFETWSSIGCGSHSPPPLLVSLAWIRFSQNPPGFA